MYSQQENGHNSFCSVDHNIEGGNIDEALWGLTSKRLKHNLFLDDPLVRVKKAPSMAYYNEFPVSAFPPTAMALDGGLCQEVGSTRVPNVATTCLITLEGQWVVYICGACYHLLHLHALLHTLSTKGCCRLVTRQIAQYCQYRPLMCGPFSC